MGLSTDGWRRGNPLVFDEVRRIAGSNSAHLYRILCLFADWEVVTFDLLTEKLDAERDQIRSFLRRLIALGLVEEKVLIVENRVECRWVVHSILEIADPNRLKTIDPIISDYQN